MVQYLPPTLQMLIFSKTNDNDDGTKANDNYQTVTHTINKKKCSASNNSIFDVLYQPFFASAG